MSSWGVDFDRYEAASRVPRAINQATTSSRMKFPREMIRARQAALVRIRMLVNETDSRPTVAFNSMLVIRHLNAKLAPI